MNSWTLCLLTLSFVPIPQVTQCCTQDLVAAIGQSPDVGTVGSSTPIKGLVTGSAYRARVRCGWKSGKVGRPYGAGASPAITSVTCEEYRPVVKCPALPKEQNLGPITSAEVGRALSARVMERLQVLETHEPNLHFKSDYRQAWITQSFLLKGTANAFVQASYVIYGCHPDFVWPNIVADRKQRLGKEYYDFYDSADLLRPDVPPIPSSSAALLPSRIAANGANSEYPTTHGLVGPIPTKERIV